MAGDRAPHEGKKPPSGSSKSRSRFASKQPRSKPPSGAALPPRTRGDKRQKFVHDRPEHNFWQDRDSQSRDIVSTMSCHERYQGPPAPWKEAPWKEKREDRKLTRPGGGHRGVKPGKDDSTQRNYRFSIDWPPDFATSSSVRKQKKALEAPRPKKHDTSHGVQTA